MISGLVEAFYITDLDVRKDANLACLCLARTLEIVFKILTDRKPIRVLEEAGNKMEGVYLQRPSAFSI